MNSKLTLFVLASLVTVGFASVSSARDEQPGYYCNATASNGVGRNGQTYWGTVGATPEEAQENAIRGCNMRTSHGPCQLNSCWYQN